MKEYSYGIAPYIFENDIIKILVNTSPKDDWNFFKGKIEDNESVKECAIREFYEEYGVLVDENDLDTYFYSTSKRKNIGLFLVNFKPYINIKETICKREIYIYNFMNISNIVFSKNQRELQNKIIFRLKEIERWNLVCKIY